MLYDHYKESPESDDNLKEGNDDNMYGGYTPLL